MVAAFRGRDEVTVFRRHVPPASVRQATALALFSTGMVFAFTIALATASHLSFIDVLFEVMSALGTVGFTAAGTVSFGDAGHIILMVAMLFGRFSPLMVSLYMTKPRRAPLYQHPTDSVRLG
jgi:trk system potassium uptake protein TrkH